MERIDDKVGFVRPSPSEGDTSARREDEFRIGFGILEPSQESGKGTGAAAFADPGSSADVALCLALAQKGVFDVYRSHLSTLSGQIAAGAERSQAYVSHMSELIRALRASAGATDAQSQGSASVDTIDHWTAIVAMYLAHKDDDGGSGKLKALASGAQDEITSALENAGLSPDIAGDVASSLVHSVYLAATMSGSNAHPDIGAIVSVAAQKLSTLLGQCVVQERDRLVQRLQVLHHAVQDEVRHALTSSEVGTSIIEGVEHDLFKSRAPSASEQKARQRDEKRTEDRELELHIETERGRSSMV